MKLFACEAIRWAVSELAEMMESGFSAMTEYISEINLQLF